MALIDYQHTSLFADDVQKPHRSCTILNPAADLVRGTVMGRNTTTGKWSVSTTAATDGTQIPRGILAYDIPNQNADTQAAIFSEGSFVAEKLTYGAGHTAATVEAACAANSIDIIIKSVGAVLPA